MRNYNLSVNLLVDNQFSTNKLKQFDDNNRIELSILAHPNMTEPQMISLDATKDTVVAIWERADGTIFDRTCTIEDDKIITYTDKQLLALTGVLKLECVIFKDGEEATTQTIVFQVDKSIDRDSSIQNDPSYTSDLVGELIQVKDVCVTKTDGLITNVDALTANLNTLNNKHTNDYNTLTSAIADNALNISTNQTTIDSISQTVTGHTASIIELLKHGTVVGSLTEFEQALDNVGKVGYSNVILFKAGAYVPMKEYELPSYTYIGSLGDGEVIFRCVDSGVINIFRNKLNGTEKGYSGSHHITIENLTFDGLNTINTLTPVAFGHASNCHVRGCTFKRFNTWHNIEINGSNKIFIENNTFDDYGNTNGGNPTEAVQIDFMGGNSQYPWASEYDGTVCIDIYIKGNTFTNIKASAIGNHIYGSFSNGIHIEDNYFYNCTTCVSLGDCNGVTFNNNTCGSCRYGIHQLGNTITNNLWDWKVEGNKFQGMRGQTGYADNGVENRFIYTEATSQGYCINRFSIKNNIVMDCNTHGIGITANYVSCNGNTVSSCGKIGIFIYGCSQGTVNDNLVTNCGLSNVNWRNFPIAMGANSQKGCWGLIISGNTCIGGTVASLENVDANCIRANNLEIS